MGSNRKTYICEVCDKTSELSEEEAYSSGWDYPPFMGIKNIVSPRTCGDCGIEGTLWWALMVNKESLSSLSDKHKETLKRIEEE
jgi:hypothetical protein